MIVTFTNPCPSGNLEGSSFLNKSKLTFETTKGGQILCPYDGVVKSSTSNEAIIVHNVLGNEWTSTLKNFRCNVIKGRKVREGDYVGLTDEGEFTFKVNPSVDAEKLITIGVDVNKTSKKSDDGTDGETNFTNTRNQGDDAADDFLKIFLSPFDFAQGALNLNKKKINEDTQVKIDLINEDIDRMKKLF